MKQGSKTGLALISLAVVIALAGGAFGFSVGYKVGLGENIPAVTQNITVSGSESSSYNGTDGAAPSLTPDTTIGEPSSSPSSTQQIVDDTTEEELMQLIDPIKVDKSFKVAGYYPSWGGSDHEKIRFDVLTHINYSFAIPTVDGDIRPLENPERAQAIIKEAHKHNVKVLIAVGGWSYNDNPLEPAFKGATETSEKTKKLVDNIMKLVDQYGFDGVDMDWEHPRFGEPSQQQYFNLMESLRAEVNKRNLLLTAAVVSGPTPDGTVLYDAGAHTDEVISLVDWLNIMAYDGGDGDRHSSYDFAVACGNYWSKTRGIAKEKCVLGLPFYGRPSWAAYEDILASNPDAYKTDISTINGMQAHYNGIATIQKKTKFAAENLGGVMIWEITQDTPDKAKSLQNAIGEALLK